MWDLPGPGLEPVSPALAGGFLTTAPPGKPLSPSLPEYSCFTDFLSELPFHSEGTIQQLPCKRELPKVADEPPRVSFTLWSKMELRAIVKAFPKPREEPQKFFEESGVIIRALTPGCKIFISLCTCR